MAQKKKIRAAQPLARRRLLQKEKKTAVAIRNGFGLLFAFALLFGALSLGFSYGVDSFQPQLSAALSRMAGRPVRLGGSVGLRVIWGKGLALSVRDVSIDNPPWARRASFAHIGQLDIGIAFRPLLDRRIDIFSLDVQKADIQFEKGPRSAINWDVMAAAETMAGASRQEGKTWTYALKAQSARIEKSRLTFVGEDGVPTPVFAEKLEIAPQGDKADVHFVGVVADIPVRMDVTGGALEDVLADLWPFQADVQYGNLVAHVEGVVQDAATKIAISRSRIVSNDSNFSAVLRVDLTKERPLIEGDVMGGSVLLSDFSSRDLRQELMAEGQAAIKARQTSMYFFDTEEINLAPLVGFDMDVNVNLNALRIGLTKLDAVKARLLLTNGRLLVSPFSGYIAEGKVEGQLKIDASAKPAHYTFVLNARHVDLSHLSLIVGSQGFLTGKVDMDIDMTAKGNSQREMASTAQGTLNLKGMGGTLSGQALNKIEHVVLSALMPGQSPTETTGMNCIAMNLVVKDGFLAGDGVAIETPYAQIYAHGFSDLHVEKLEYQVKTAVRVAGLSSALPELMIRGTWISPVYSADAVAGAQALLSSLSNKIEEIRGGQFSVAASSVQPTACTDLLQRKMVGGLVASPSPRPSLAPYLEKSRHAVEKIGNAVWKGLEKQFLKGE